jgi:hypothetical protein
MSSQVSCELDERLAAVREKIELVKAGRLVAEGRVAAAEEALRSAQSDLSALHTKEGHLRFDLGELEKMRKVL